MHHPENCFVAALLLALLLTLTGCDNSSSESAHNGADTNSSRDNSSGNTDIVEHDVNAPGTEDTVKPIKFPDTYIKLALSDTAGTTEKITVGSDGAASNGNSIASAISANGRYVVFDSIASTLTANDTNDTWDIFLRDRELSITRRLSLSVDGGDANDASLDPVISDNASVIVFSSSASNLVANDMNGSSDIFSYSIVDNAIERISVDSSGNESDGDSRLPDVSYNGRFVVFESAAANLVAGDNNQAADVFLYDRANNSIERVSLSHLGEGANGPSYEPAVSDDGRFIVFASDADNLVVNDNNNVKDIFVRDRQENTTRRLSVSSAGLEADADSDTADISGNGKIAVFRSDATNLVAGDTNSAHDIFSYDLQQAKTDRLSVNSLGEEANTAAFTKPTITVDGRYVAFYSSASNLAANDVNASWDVFVHDRTEQVTHLVSVNNNAMAGDASSFEPYISAYGHYVVFGSVAANLTPEDLNESWDIFLHVLSTANVPPIADAGADQSVMLGDIVQLDGSHSVDPDANEGIAGEVSSYQWQFESTPAGSNVVLGGADTATPRFAPDLPGTYLVSLVVGDAEQLGIIDEVLIRVVENVDPVAAIDVQVISGNVPFNVIVDASRSTDPEGDRLTVHWDFGDPGSEQNSSSELIVGHTYVRPGEYRIVLTVTDSLGNTDKASVTIGVLASNNPPTVNPTATAVSGVAPLMVTFAANAADPDNDNLVISWDFGDGKRSNETNPSHVYTETGVYEARVTVTDGVFHTEAAITIAVNSEIQLITKKAVIVLKGRHDDKDKLLFQGKLIFDGLPLEDEQIRFMLDDTMLLDVPFSAFKLLEQPSGIYLYTGKHEIAVLNVTNGTLKYSRHKAMLNGINYVNGVSVRFSIGERVAIQSITMRKLKQHKVEKHADDDVVDNDIVDNGIGDNDIGNNDIGDDNSASDDDEQTPAMQAKKVVLVYLHNELRKKDRDRNKNKRDIEDKHDAEHEDED